MSFFVKGNGITGATAYKLYKKISGNLVDFKSPTNAPAGVWTYDSSNNTWVMKDSEYMNIRWHFVLTAGTTITWSFVATNVQGTLVATLRDSANTTLSSPTKNADGVTHSLTYTVPSDGEYSVRIAGATAPNSAVISNMTVMTGVGDQYILIDTQDASGKVIKHIFNNPGYISDNGEVITTGTLATDKYHSDILPISSLANGPDGYCVGAFDLDYTEFPKICFFEGPTIDTYLGSVNIDGGLSRTLTVEQVISHANDAKYVAFNSDNEITAIDGKDVVYISLGFIFALADYPEQLPAGETHILVVKAIGEGGVDANGDNIIYEDSDYSNEVEYTATGGNTAGGGDSTGSGGVGGNTPTPTPGAGNM